MEEEVEVTDQPNALREIINYSFKSVFYKGRRKKKQKTISSGHIRKVRIPVLAETYKNICLF